MGLAAPISTFGKGDERGKKDGQRQRQRGHENGEVEQQRANDIPSKIFADDVVEVLQHVLKQEDEDDNEEREDKRPDERLDNELVDLAHAAAVSKIAPFFGIGPKFPMADPLSSALRMTEPPKQLIGNSVRLSADEA